MKQISRSHYFLYLLTSSASQYLRLTALFPCDCKLVFCSVLWRIQVGGIYSFIGQNLKFDWSMQVTLKRRAIGKSDLFEQAEIFAGTATWNESCQILQLFFSFPCRRRWFIFTKHVITVYFQFLFTAIWFYCFNIDVLKNFTNFTGKHLYRNLFLVSLRLLLF